MFGRLVREDQSLRLINLGFLSVIVFLPFPTSVIATHADRGSVVFYAGAVSTAGILMTALSVVAGRAALADPNLEHEHRDAIIRSMPAPVVFLASIGVAQVSPFWAMQFWWLIAPVSWLSSWLSRASRNRSRT